MADFAHEISNWVSGVILSSEGDKIADDALLVAKNTQFVKTAPGVAALATRPGMTKATTFKLINPMANAKWLGSYPYAVNGSTAFSQYLVWMNELGYFMFKEPDDSWDQSEIATSAFGDPAEPNLRDHPDVINHTLYDNKMLVIGGPARRWFIGKQNEPFGLNPPDVTVSVVNAAVTVPDSGLPFPNLAATNFPAGNYDVFVTSYSKFTGTESVPKFVSTFTIAANQALQVVPTSSTIFEFYRVYLRRQATQANAYLVTEPKFSDSSLVTTDGTIPIATTVFINPTIAEIADYILPMPGMTENSKLSDEALYVATFGRRIVAASRRKLFYSKLDVPYAFPPQNFEILDINGGEIVGLLPVEDELLLVFTTNGVWGLFGIDPQYWVLKPISLTIGCAGFKSIVKFDGGVAWWSPQVGPVIMRGQEIEKIGTERLGLEIIDSVPSGLLGLISAGWCPYHKLVVWSVPCRGSVKNNCLLPYQYELGAWCASEWDSFGVPVMATGYNKNREQRLFLMDHEESLYYLDSTQKFDGITPSMGTVEGTTSAASAATSLSGTGFYVFSVLSNNMKGQKIVFTDASGLVLGQREIVSNNATTVSWDRAIDLVTGGKYYISTPTVEIGTKLFDGGQAFLRKRFDRLYLHIYGDDPNRALKIFYEKNHLDKTKTFVVDVNVNSAETATLDATWDVPVLVNVPLVKKRINIFVNAHVLKLTFQYPAPGPVMISKIALIGRLLNERYYA